LSKDGSRKRVLGFVRPIRDDGGFIRGIVTSFRCPASRDHRHGLPLEILRDVHLRLTGGSTGAHVPAILKAVSFIEENLEESLTLDDIARAANMSKYHFTRLFKKHIGLSPVSFASRLRIERAKQMLQTAAGNISEVSVSVGFRSINHFVKRFKRLVGMTPADYRELYK
jgi:transcriptional regulator GlxA family with amidase domain